MDNSFKISEIEPMISVIVPAYNAEEFLPICIDSILEQTYENIEIIIVNDGSNDQTGYIAEQYGEKHPNNVKCIHLQNGGVMKARIAGIKAARGEWIGFVDSDDIIEPDMYKRLVGNALCYKTDISHCGYQTIVNGGERIHYFYNTGKFVQQDNMTGLRDLLTGVFVEPGLWNKLFRKELFANLICDNSFPSNIKINEDLLMNYYLFKQAKTSVYEDFCPYHYITRSSSVTRSEFKVHKAIDPIRVRKIILDDVTVELTDVALQKYLVSCLNACTMLHGRKEYHQLYKEIKRELVHNRNKWNVLRKNELIKVRMILFSATLYKFIFGIYENYFQKKIYE